MHAYIYTWALKWKPRRADSGSLKSHGVEVRGMFDGDEFIISVLFFAFLYPELCLSSFKSFSCFDLALV